MASKSRKNKVKFKWTKELIFLIVGIVAILVATIILSIPSSESKKLDEYNEKIQAYNTKNSASCQTLNKDHCFKEITYSGLKSKIDKTSDDDYVYVLYGSFDQGDFVSNLSVIDTEVKNLDDSSDVKINTVYLMYSTWVEEYDDTDSVKFKDKAKDIEDGLNAKKLADVDDFDVEVYPALLVFKGDSLVYNSQTFSTESEGNWNLYINHAFTIEVKALAEKESA